ncbi:hypothetical protein HALLA_00205 (plasmid) [Halostagnicola larsenii XH-48]|uniref:Halobacterial output domain-containing protein n=2 Tax=Halostagnicola larsenii TaxID=353800 RepID=W0JWY6_9EURY|nr:hypothetical protein HALLA_00205 [Halostagnicola larsenii XH-48]
MVTNVIEAVAAADGVDPADLDSLYKYIDPEVLEQLAEQDGTEWSFTFRYLDHQITVTHDGQIRVDGALYASDVLTK